MIRRHEDWLNDNVVSVRTDTGKTVRVAVFIDGGFLEEASRYHKFIHSRKARIRLDGLLDFVRWQTAYCEGIDLARCHVAEAHYFRGRFAAETAVRAGKLEDDRRLDDTLMRAGVVPHFLPVNESGERPCEKGIDVWLALETYDLAVSKHLDVVAIVAGDSDYVPLVRKLNGLGVRVMLLGWDFSYAFEERGLLRRKQTRTSQELARLATYPLCMNALIDDGSFPNPRLIDGLFVQPVGNQAPVEGRNMVQADSSAPPAN